MIFDLQLFGGGKGGVTYNTTAYESTEHKLKLQRLQTGFVEEIMPNAKMLNTAAANLLTGSIGDDVLDFAEHLRVAHVRYEDAYNALFAGADWISNCLDLIDNHSGDFDTINTAYTDDLVFGCESIFYKDAGGNPRHYSGFFDFAAHLLYDHTEIAMGEIATTLRTVSNDIYAQAQSVLGGYQEYFDETERYYQQFLKSEDTSLTFETIANDNAGELSSISGSLKTAANDFATNTQNLPVKISDSATLSNASLET